MAAFPKYKVVQTDSLIPYARNSRTHTDEQVSQVAASIKEFGFLNPIIVDGENGIIAGHCRVLAAQKLGIDKLPTIAADHLTEAQRKAYIIADNKLALNAGWDFDLLKIEINELQDLDFDIELTGFDPDELAEILKDTTEGLTDEDAVPEAPENPVTVLGDVWVLGKHRLVCGDCADTSAWDRLEIPDGFVVFTSPPYNAGESSGLRDKYQKGVPKTRKFYNEYDDGKSPDDYMSMIREFVDTSFGYVDTVAVNIQMLSGNKKPLMRFMDEMADHIVDVITWDKKTAAPHIQPGILASRFEWILILSRDNATRVVPHSSWQGKHSNVYTAPNASQNEYSKVHGATFPVHLPEFIVGDLMNRCRGVVDCFGGTGTTTIAAEKLNRESRLIELSPEYCDVIVKRWQDFTGNDAIHEASGKTFAEVSQNPVEAAA